MKLYNGNNSVAKRLEFQNALAALSDPAANLNPQSIAESALTQSFLRLEQPLTAGLTTINFPILNTQTGNANAVRATEKRLKQQDAFYVAGISIFLTKAASAADTALKLTSYPNPVTYAVTGEAAGQYTFYNGNYNMVINNNVIVPAYPLSDFLVVPQTQLTAQTNSPIDEFYGEQRMVLQPNPVFIGQKDNQFNIVLPGPVAAVQAFTYVVVILHGVLAQNVTAVS